MKVASIVLLSFVLAVLPLTQISIAQEEGAEGLRIERLVACTSVDLETREPVGVGESFPEDVGRLVAFTSIAGAGEGTSITHAWYRKGSLVARVSLDVRGDRWRTWSSKTIPADWAGDWEVAVLDADGKELARIEFKVGD